ncbi:MAG: aldo/keto reductase, partial [Halobacteriaceae archaeon]
PDETLPALAELKDRGTIKHIGVSNFEIKNLETARDILGDDIFANQIELHPYLQQPELRDYCNEHSIEIVAYSPLARGDVLSDDTIQDIAAKHEISPAQVVLAWIRELGLTTIPKASSEQHIRDNWQSLQCNLDESDKTTIREDIQKRTRKVDPGWAPWR